MEYYKKITVTIDPSIEQKEPDELDKLLLDMCQPDLERMIREEDKFILEAMKAGKKDGTNS